MKTIPQTLRSAGLQRRTVNLHSQTERAVCGNRQGHISER